MTTCVVSLLVSLVLPPIRIHVHMFVCTYLCIRSYEAVLVPVHIRQ